MGNTLCAVIYVTLRSEHVGRDINDHYIMDEIYGVFVDAISK